MSGRKRSVSSGPRLLDRVAAAFAMGNQSSSSSSAHSAIASNSSKRVRTSPPPSLQPPTISPPPVPHSALAAPASQAGDTEMSTGNSSSPIDLTSSSPTTLSSQDELQSQLLELGFEPADAFVAVSACSTLEKCIDYLYQIQENRDAKQTDNYNTLHHAAQLEQREWLCSCCHVLNAGPESVCILCHTAKAGTNASASNVPTAECCICYEPIAPMQRFAGLRCHAYCGDCIKQHILSSIDAGRAADVQCPEPGCTSDVGDEIVSLQKILDTQQLMRFLRIRDNAILSKRPDTRWCLSGQGCEDPMLNGNPYDPRMLCKKCQHAICFNCNVVWHDRMTCAEFQSIRARSQEHESDRALMDWASQHNVRQCYQCRALVEKTSGCDKFRCRCGAKWCHKCGSIDAQCRCTGSNHGFFDNATVQSNWYGAGPDRGLNHTAVFNQIMNSNPFAGAGLFHPAMFGQRQSSRHAQPHHQAYHTSSSSATNAQTNRQANFFRF